MSPSRRGVYLVLGGEGEVAVLSAVWPRECDELIHGSTLRLTCEEAAEAPVSKLENKVGALVEPALPNFRSSRQSSGFHSR